MSFLQVDNVSHQYFSKSTYTKALHSITLTVEKGEFISLLGPSGCGKSTLLSIISGLVKPTEGNVLIEGGRHSRTDYIGYMLQQDYLFPWKTIEENVTLGPKIQHKGSVPDILKQKAVDLLQQMGVGHVRESYPRELSGGMRQRAALARTLCTDPKIVLLDEPFSALDYQTKLKLENLVADKLTEYEQTSVLVTHDIEEAIAMSDRIYLLKANPGEIARTFTIPDSIRLLPPFEARQHPDFQSTFQSIWKELNALDSATG
ncbi:spermidine/putrescine ABC transporter ATP-binding protein [Pontibacillus halophilus JSM 076056 = DSM 19796]|uniref:Spermidine/putrescine ABC transporter ATP-binding protein n=1 Tax=Pontibacillus halophilus JSM 076056 = DSM 19796 TaxID=1385510 RepID=A0A0A5GE84_9BACI|nr:ABC transporter ATP-binding protein [Pontibacillus halophilus]KGX89508.1 spermidine/putrescine ABC transporter ATP-binding protein [Pontibacillus halophilus JSM 076056 = DSM 19796]